MPAAHPIWLRPCIRRCNAAQQPARPPALAERAGAMLPQRGSKAGSAPRGARRPARLPLLARACEGGRTGAGAARPAGGRKRDGRGGAARWAPGDAAGTNGARRKCMSRRPRLRALGMTVARAPTTHQSAAAQERGLLACMCTRAVLYSSGEVHWRGDLHSGAWWWGAGSAWLIERTGGQRRRRQRGEPAPSKLKARGAPAPRPALPAPSRSIQWQVVYHIKCVRPRGARVGRPCPPRVPQCSRSRGETPMYP